MNFIYLRSDSFQIILSCILLTSILLCKLSICYYHRCNNRNVLFFSWLWYIFSISYNALEYNTLVPKDMNSSCFVRNERVNMKMEISKEQTYLCHTLSRDKCSKYLLLFKLWKKSCTCEIRYSLFSKLEVSINTGNLKVS